MLRKSLPAKTQPGRANTDIEEGCEVILVVENDTRARKQLLTSFESRSPGARRQRCQ
jgi:hypothetical protein